MLRLGVNIDHVATVRNARGGMHPDPVRAAHIVAQAGADSLTAHLREDRRHITDDDVHRLKQDVELPLNLEIAPTDEMVGIALACRPFACCFVPERRQERTTECGLDLLALRGLLRPYVQSLRDAGIRVSVFIEPKCSDVDVARELGVSAVELHTGKYCHSYGQDRVFQLQCLREAASYAEGVGLECHAGHGLCFETVGPVAAISSISELNIGHFLVGESLFCGLEHVIRSMRSRMDEARRGAA